MSPGGKQVGHVEVRSGPIRTETEGNGQEVATRNKATLEQVLESGKQV